MFPDPLATSLVIITVTHPQPQMNTEQESHTGDPECATRINVEVINTPARLSLRSVYIFSLSTPTPALEVCLSLGLVHLPVTSRAESGNDNPQSGGAPKQLHQKCELLETLRYSLSSSLILCSCPPPRWLGWQIQVGVETNREEGNKERTNTG